MRDDFRDGAEIVIGYPDGSTEAKHVIETGSDRWQLRESHTGERRGYGWRMTD